MFDVAVEGLCLLSYPVRRGSFRLPLFCVLETIPRLPTLVFVILGLRPGTRQDSLKNSSGLLVPSVGVSLPRVGPRGSLSFRRYLASARSVPMKNFYVNRRASLRALWERQDSNLRCVQICFAFVLSATLPWWRAGLPPVKQTHSIIMTQNIRVLPCTRVSCTVRHMYHQSVLLCRCTLCRCRSSRGVIRCRCILGRGLGRGRSWLYRV